MKKLLLLTTVFLILLAGCSRESDIRVNGSLRNNHSVVFAFTERPDSAGAFVDSIAALDSVYTYDTLTVTVNDTIYFMGFLKYNAKKVLRYAWNMGDKDTLLSGANGEIFAHAFDSAGIYSPLFIAVDGANARDTAGRDQFIRVIDTPPDLSVSTDTLWTRGERDAEVSFFASDSFGTIEKAFVLLLDSKNKDKISDTVWATLSDSTRYTAKIKYSAASKIFDDNNLKYVCGAIDDDANVTLDTAILHFNKIPTIELLQPDSAARQSIFVSRFAFYYSAADGDNPQDLRYSIRVGKSPDNSGTAPVLTDANLVATDVREKSWEAIVDSVWQMDESLRGRLYWQVSATDGYDTVTSPTWNFFFGDLSATTGTIYGYAKFQGRTAHNGIQIVMENLESHNYTFSHTNEKGFFSVKVEAGSYKVYARDTTGFGYKHMELDSQYVEMGDERLVATMLLEDSMPPKIRIDSYDTLITSRSVRFAGALSDSGSQIKEGKAWFDDGEVKLTTLKVNEWAMQFDNLLDGTHQFKFVVLDSAKNVSDTAKISFRVKASSMELTVNGQSTSMISSDGQFVFKANVSKVQPVPDSVYWTCTIEGQKYAVSPTAVKNDTASFVLKASDLKGAVNGTLYTMYASVANGTVTDSVRFGILGDDPSVFFLAPQAGTSVTMNDSLRFKLEAFPGKSATIKSITWNCPATLSEGYTCPTAGADALEGLLAWKSLGTKKVVVTLEDSEGRKATDTMTVQVIADPPTITIKTTADTVRQKINAELSYSVTATDRYGTVEAVEWGCGTNAANIKFESAASVTAGKTVSATIDVKLPSTETNAYKCIVRATDDDGEFGYDTIFFRAVLDKPSITLFTHAAEVKINSKQRFAGSAVDTLGTIVSYEMYCGTSSVKNPTWIAISKPDTTITMPSNSKDFKYLCWMRVTDDDGLTDIDSATYSVLLDPPTVKVSDDTLTVTIKDTLTLDAIANDKLGSIVLYEWSCGASGVAGQKYVSSTSTPRYTAIMPSVAENNYRCIIRVTDDDGNTAMDTTKITVLLDPPTVKVFQKSLTTRPGYSIEINADASDKYGYIAKREWSCGEPSDIGLNWKTVSDFDTTWTGPSSATETYYCVARATDDDGNKALDTIRISFTTEIPVITVDNNLLYIKAGASVDLTARANNVWQGIKRYTWTCGAKNSSALTDTASAKDHHIWWGVDSNYTTSDFYFWDTDAKGKARNTISALSKSNTEFLCIVWAEESGTRYVGTDTTVIHSIATSDLPVGVIDMPDTVYLWSRDSSVSDEGKYWYTPSITAANSKPGTLGTGKTERFFWSFSTVSETFYEGNTDGTLDTNIAEFNAAFVRDSVEGSMTVKLLYMDSSKAEGMDQAFYDRHQAEVVTKTVYFRKAWKNISSAKDSILAKSTNENGPAIAYCNDRLITAYVNESGSIVTAYQNGKNWTTFGSPSASDVTAQSLYLNCDGNNNLYLYYINSSDKKGYVYKSANSTGNWAQLGSALGTSVTAFKLRINPKTNNPSVIWLGTVNGTVDQAQAQDYSGSAWGTAFSPVTNSYWQYREVDMAFDANGNRLVIGVGHDGDDYKMYYYYIASGSTSTSNGTDTSIPINAESVALHYQNGYFYVTFRSRDDDGLPRMARATASSNLRYSGQFTTSGSEFEAFGHRSYNAAFAFDKNGNPIAAIDDAYYPANSQVHVYRYENGWKELGENELPYFKNIYAHMNGYYVRGFRPQLAVSSTGRIFLSLRAQETKMSAGSTLPGTKNGPMVMEYVGDNW